MKQGWSKGINKTNKARVEQRKEKMEQRRNKERKKKLTKQQWIKGTKIITKKIMK